MSGLSRTFSNKSLSLAYEQYHTPIILQLSRILSGLLSHKIKDPLRLLANSIEESKKLLNFWKHETATVFGREHHPLILLNLLGSFFHSPSFWKRSSCTLCYSSWFHFHSCPLILRYIPRQLSQNETPLLQRNSLSIAYDVARQHEYRSWVSNFALFTKDTSSLTNQYSVILPLMLLSKRTHLNLV